MTYCAIHVPAFTWVFCFACLFRVKPQRSFLNWFEVVKLVSVIVGVAWMDCGYNGDLLFRINIVEAVISDAIHRRWIEVIIGLFLCITRLNIIHALIYTAWNIRFSSNGGFSPSTRILLLVPFILMPTWTHQSWLIARSKSLLLHMTMRATHFTWFYTPGKSSVTH